MGPVDGFHDIHKCSENLILNSLPGCVHFVRFEGEEDPWLLTDSPGSL